MQPISQKTLASWRASIKLARCEHQHALLKNLDRIKANKATKEIAAFESKLEKSCAHALLKSDFDLRRVAGEQVRAAQ